MPVIYSSTIKTARMNATRLEVVGGTLEVLTAGDVVLATWDLGANAGSVTGSSWTFTPATPSVTAAASGVPAKAQIKDSGGTTRVTGLTVSQSIASGGVGGGDLDIDQATITSGEAVVLSSAAFAHA